MGIRRLPVAPAYSLTCADLWRGWVYASSGVLGSVSGSQEADLAGYQENIAETFEQLKRSLESESNLSSDNDNDNIVKRMAYDAGFSTGTSMYLASVLNTSICRWIPVMKSGYKW